MNESAPVFLSALAYELGVLHPIGTLPELADKAAVLENLAAVGLRNYAASTEPSTELARRSMQATLARMRVATADVDAIVYATNHLHDRDLREHPLKVLLHELGLTHAYLFAVSASACANLHVALRVAGGLIRSGEYRNLLVVTADRNSELEPESRIFSTNVSICSDAAASFLFSTEAESGIRWRGTAVRSDTRLVPLNATHQLDDYFAYMMGGVRACSARALALTGLALEDVSKLILNNYNRSVSTLLAHSIGLDTSLLFDDNIARFAHAYAADNAINLHDYLATRAAGRGVVMMVGSGPNCWGATLVELAS